MNKLLKTLLVLLAGLALTAAAPLRPARQATLPFGEGKTATTLVMDVSGSMGDTWSGGVKIESARAAAHQILNMLQQESSLGGPHRVGIASFTDTAYLLQPLSADTAAARQVVDSLTSLNGTNLGAGLETGNTILAQAAPDEARILILLSDGMSNVGMDRSQILAGPVQAAVNARTCIYTIGFGDPGALDEALLQQIAAASQSATGCGAYYYATDVISLESTYIRIRHQTTGNILNEFTGSVAQGQTVQAGTVNVPSNQEELAISLHWPGSKMKLVLHDPAGAIVPENDPKLRLTSYNNLVYALVVQPTPGNWLVEVVGEQIPSASEPFEVVVSARPASATSTPPPPPVVTPLPLPQARGGGVPVALVLVVLGGAGVALYVYASVLQRKRGARTPVQAPAGTPGIFFAVRLQAVSGPASGQVFHVRSTPASLGRGPANQIILADQAISRLHATLHFSAGEWFIQDQNSSSGVYVNGQRVSQAGLRRGDRILLGNTELLFQAA